MTAVLDRWIVGLLHWLSEPAIVQWAEWIVVGFVILAVAAFVALMYFLDRVIAAKQARRGLIRNWEQDLANRVRRFM